jgi:hypothetical protein
MGDRWVFLCLPLELIHEVTDHVPSTSTSDLRTLRLVSRTFCKAATPRVFRILHVTNSAKSVKRLTNIHESDCLRHFVEEVVFQYEAAKWALKSKYLGAYKVTKEQRYLMEEDARVQQGRPTIYFLTQY